MMTCIIPNYASMPKVRSALKRTNARELITEWKDCTTKLNTRPSFATVSQMSSQSASMVSIAHLLTPLKILKFAYSVMSKTRTKILSFIYTTLKQSGAP